MIIIRSQRRLKRGYHSVDLQLPAPCYFKNYLLGYVIFNTSATGASSSTPAGPARENYFHPRRPLPTTRPDVTSDCIEGLYHSLRRGWNMDPIFQAMTRSTYAIE